MVGLLQLPPMTFTSQKALLAHLKAAGLAKMGVRQRAAMQVRAGTVERECRATSIRCIEFKASSVTPGCAMAHGHL